MPQARDEAGNIWETDAQGNPVRLLQAASGPQMPADPAFPYQGAQAAAQAQNTGATAEVNAATVPDQIRTAAAQATAAERAAQTAGLAEGQMWGPDGVTAVPIPGYTRQGLSPEVRSAALQGYSDATALESIADDLEKKFKSGPGATSGFPEGIADYFPSDANKRFNDAGQRARGYVKRSLGFTGGEGNTVAESSALYDPYLPTSWDRDAQVVDKIAELRRLAQTARQKATATLGGTPDANGNVMPNAMTQVRIGNGADIAAAGSGATQGNTVAIPPGMAAEKDALVAQLMQQGGGRIDPEAYVRGVEAIVAKYPGFGITPESSAKWASDVNSYLDRGGSTVPGGLQLQDRELTDAEQERNNLVANPLGAAAAGFADMGSFGGVSALAPDKMDALSNEQPLATGLGQIGGALTGTAALGRLGTETIGRAAPRLLGGRGGAQFGRNLATDATYSGTYGGVTEGDPLTGAALGAVGSAGGQAIGKGVGMAIGGVDLAPAVEFLRQRNIPMTVPQQLGGFVKNLEDKAISMPLVGDMIRARRMEGMGAFNREAFNEAGGPINAAVQEVGQEGIEQLGDQVSDAYTTATSGVTVPFDPQFQADFGAAVGRGQYLPPDLRGGLADILNARIAPITDTGQMTGDQFQQAMRALKATRNRPPSRFEGFEEDYRDVVSDTMDALTGPMLRGGGDQTVAGLTTANAANRNLRTIEDATTRAKGGSETGTPFVFTPSQLQAAGLKTKARYPGARPFGELADAGQEVLPSRIPNSGTADRAAQMMLPGAILGGGGLGALAGGDVQGAGTGAGVSTLAMLALLAGGTKTGQKALQRLVIDRPATMKQLGRQIRNRTGLFGSATLPAMIADY
jgi:hypothetical protein